ncbi:hypothetical protein NP493_185g04026 [Ridgeia piscesae]|uniref:RRM domain-containing protein n=1 Tax=Ridgeia piscesae TaxID=27915 RepID=A0AAD9P2K2_RIDPI|nr:hypothetical protein NP493_185g04026 [Ridgeia piscesae]
MAARKGRTIPTKIYVGNLPETCRRQDLLESFEKYGKVTECDIVRNYAFVHMESADEAQLAVDGLNSSDFNGSKITVQLSTSKVRQQPGMGNNVNEPRRPYPKTEERPATASYYPGTVAPPYARYREPPIYSRDPYDPYYRERAYPAVDRYRPYADPYERALVRPARDPYYVRERDPYARPPPDYYLARQSPPPVSREYVRAYYEDRGRLISLVLPSQLPSVPSGRVVKVLEMSHRATYASPQSFESSAIIVGHETCNCSPRRLLGNSASVTRQWCVGHSRHRGCHLATSKSCA